jgi:SOS response regulatory protein OraA/RecX
LTKDVTTIRISTELRDKLRKLGIKGETYEEIIERVLKIAEENTGGKH